MKIYYAHCRAIYNKELEGEDLKTLHDLGFQVVNPNAPEHQAGYKVSGMEYFKHLVATCDALAFRALPDSSITAGVFSEISAATDYGIPIIELPSFAVRRNLTANQTRQYLKEVGFKR